MRGAGKEGREEHAGCQDGSSRVEKLAGRVPLSQGNPSSGWDSAALAQHEACLRAGECDQLTREGAGRK